MPKMPVTQHQKTAPGPPKAIAVETPMIFPVPRVAARVVERVAKTERLLPSPASEGDTERQIAFIIFFCGRRSFMVKYKCVPMSRNRRGPLHKNSLMD